MSGGETAAGCWDLPKVSPASHQPPLQCANPCNYCPNSGDSRHCGQQTRCKMHNTHGQLLANIIVFVLYLFIRTDYFVSRIPCISISMVPLKLRALFIVSFSLLSCLEELSSTQLFINLKYTHCAIPSSGKRAVFRHILLLWTMAHSDWDYFKTPLNHNVRNSSSPGPCSGHIRAPAANKHSPSPSALQSVISRECEVELETKVHAKACYRAFT